MQPSEAVVGAKVQDLNGFEYTIGSVREANAPEGFTEVTLNSKHGVTVKGDTRQLVLVSLPNDTDEQIEERKKEREKQLQEKKKLADKARKEMDKESKDSKESSEVHARNVKRAAASGDQRAINESLVGHPETYTGGVIHPLYAGTPANDALRRDGIVYPTDNSPADTSREDEKPRSAPSVNPDNLDALGDDPRQSIAGTPSQKNVKTSLEKDDRDREGMALHSHVSDDEALLEKERTTGVSGTSNEGMRALMDRMKEASEKERRGKMSEEERKEEDKKNAEKREEDAKKNRELLTEEQKNKSK